MRWVDVRPGDMLLCGDVRYLCLQCDPHGDRRARRVTWFASWDDGSLRVLEGFVGEHEPGAWIEPLWRVVRARA